MGTETKEQAFEKLRQLSIMAVGYICGARGLKDPMAYELAKALRDVGTDSTYILAIIEMNKELSGEEK